MINVKQVKGFCNEDLSLIENYDNAINDAKQTWDCHHRRETDEGLSVKQLRELGLYYGRPANELIFLTSSEHISLHRKGKKSPMYGKHFSEEHKQKLRESNSGKKSPLYGKPSTIRGKHKVWNDESDHSKGYHFEK